MKIVLLAFFVAENTVMVVTLVRVVPGVQWDAARVVVHTPSGLLWYA